MVGSFVTQKNGGLKKLLNRLHRRMFSISDPFQEDLEDLNDLYSELTAGKPLNVKTFWKIRKMVIRMTGSFQVGYNPYLDPEQPCEIFPKSPGICNFITRKIETQEVLENDSVVTQTLVDTSETETQDARYDHTIYTRPITLNAAYQDAYRRLWQFSPDSYGENFIQGYPLEEFILAANEILDLCKVILINPLLIGKITTVLKEDSIRVEEQTATPVYSDTSGYYDVLIGKTSEITTLTTPQTTSETIHWERGNYGDSSANRIGIYSFHVFEATVTGYLLGYSFHPPDTPPDPLIWFCSMDERLTEMTCELKYSLDIINRIPTSCIASIRAFLSIDDTRKNTDNSRLLNANRYSFDSFDNPILLQRESNSSHFVNGDAFPTRILEVTVSPTDGTIQNAPTLQTPELIRPISSIPSGYFGGTRDFYIYDYLATGQHYDSNFACTISSLGAILTFTDDW